MGSDSDLNIMQDAAVILRQFNIEFELTVVSAHRTPLRMVEYASKAAERGLKVIIAGAGGAAHLPGMIAAITTLPVIGVPVKSSNSIDGWDSILSILQMPNGVPVATVALNAAKNAGILAAQIIGTSNAAVAEALMVALSFALPIFIQSSWILFLLEVVLAGLLVVYLYLLRKARSAVRTKAPEKV